MAERIRKCVLAIVLYKGCVLAVKNAKRGYWGLPQGGIKKNELPEKALRRELREEIGAKELKILGKSRHRLAYDLPAKLQRITGFKGKESAVYFVETKSKRILLNKKELSAYKWLKPSELQTFLDIQNLRELSKKLLPEIGRLLSL